MDVTETLNEGLKRAYSITMTAKELDDKVMEKLTEAMPNIEMKGFRKGKVPMAMLKKQFGSQVLGEAMQEGIDGVMSKHFEETGDRPAAQPDVKMTNDAWKEGDDVIVSLEYQCLPEIPEVDLSNVTLEKMVVKAADADVDAALANLAETATDYADRKKGSKSKDGDQVVIDFLGKVDGEAFEGGSAEDYPLVLGSNSFIPGFEEQLVGAKAGDAVEVNVTFPEEYGAENLAGKAAVFECTVKEVKEPKAAEINDELATKFGAEDLAGLKGQISERLEQEFQGAARMIVKRGLMDEMDKLYSFELPPVLLDAEANQIAQQLWMEENQEAAQKGEQPEKVEPTDAHKELAARRVRLGLVLAEIGQKQEITVTDQEMQAAAIQQAQQYGAQAQQFFQFLQQNEAAQQQLRAPLFEDKVVDYILGEAKVTEKEVSKDDLEKAVEALED